ncbi:hypothetical protein EDD57_11946 [Baia soyae]|uniref:Uncharacterized protein n=1 Tax=Baia soyae TaxID=1544746 RepID=A0A4R2RVI1_9BACL|nr:hypothetical protein EDD57_11946 [Baia soyae]
MKIVKPMIFFTSVLLSIVLMFFLLFVDIHPFWLSYVIAAFLALLATMFWIKFVQNKEEKKVNLTAAILFTFSAATMCLNILMTINLQYT